MPMANFNGVDGSIFLFARASHIKAKIGARVNIKKAFKDWNIDAGTSQPMIVLSTPLSVNMFKDEPACSNSAQKINEKRIKIPTTISLSLSSGEHFKSEYPSQNAIHMAPNPPKRLPTNS
jgi:hypothetical protein